MGTCGGNPVRSWAASNLSDASFPWACSQWVGRDACEVASYLGDLHFLHLVVLAFPYASKQIVLPIKYKLDVQIQLSWEYTFWKFE